MKPIRIIPGPAGIIQMAKLHKLVDTREGREKSTMSIQKYIRKVIEDVGEDDDFTCAPWLSVIDYVNVDGGIVIGDLRVTLKDISGTISGTIHYKVLTDERLVPSCFVIYDLELLSLSFDFVFLSEIFKSLSFRLDSLCHLAILYLDQHAHTLHHLKSLLTISLDRLDIFEGRSCISEFVRKSLSLIF
ncbi:hypothetical protein Tco_0588338 [Tanacetum coccineum]